MKTSIIITAYKEPRTISRAIESIAKQKIPKSEILVVAPDAETLGEAKKMIKKYPNVKTIQDKGAGKPAAMNLAISKSKGEILVFTDGDVFILENSLKPLLEKINDRVGAVSGRPISIMPKNNKYGYWAYMLTQIAHIRRLRAVKQNKRLFCSGYLFAIKKSLIPRLPQELLSEDGYISHFVYEKGQLIAYSPESHVLVNYPTNFKDWISQKKRSAGGYNQNYKLIGAKIRSFSSESLGFMDFFRYVSSIKEFSWLMQLFAARVYLWVLIYKDINIKKKTREQIWVRVESTK